MGWYNSCNITLLVISLVCYWVSYEENKTRQLNNVQE